MLTTSAANISQNKLVDFPLLIPNQPGPLENSTNPMEKQ